MTDDATAERRLPRANGAGRIIAEDSLGNRLIQPGPTALPTGTSVCRRQRLGGMLSFYYGMAQQRSGKVIGQHGWISWCKSDATPGQPSASCASCSKGCATCRGRWSPTTLELQRCAGRASAWGRTSQRRTIETTGPRTRISQHGSANGAWRFKSMPHAQRFLSVHAAVSYHFRPCRHRLRARHYREIMHRRFAEWRAITGAGLKDRTTAR
jgi:hypothetical protein